MFATGFSAASTAATALAALAALACCTPAAAMYLPGIAPTNYAKGDNVSVSVNVLSSPESTLPFDFYDARFGFCAPASVNDEPESLGSILFGDRIHNSAFAINMQEPVACKKVCEVELSPEQTTFIGERIKELYKFNMYIDNLPAATVRTIHSQTTKTESADENSEKIYTVGFDLGRVAAKELHLNNHYEFTIFYHKFDKSEKEVFRVVGVQVHPRSAIPDGGKDQCSSKKSLNLVQNQKLKVAYTYSVQWIPSDVPWATRWDTYLKITDSRIHWLNIINSTVIVLFLSGMIAMILMRALHKDIARYNSTESKEDAQEEYGWKLVHGDVFRPPSQGNLLAVLVGNGAQLFCMTAVTLVFAILGFLSPDSRGSLNTVMLIFYVCFAYIAGFISSQIYKMLGGESWKRNVFLTAFLVPGIVFGVFVFLNFFLIGSNSSGAVPFGTMLELIVLWFLVSAPLCFLGAYFGFLRKRIEHPVRTNQIPRQIPDQVFYLQKWPSIFFGGILPFGAIYVELYFIISSIWVHQVYYMFGFLFVVFAILILTCSEVTILICYFQLCAEDYHWWWRSFLTGAAPGFYVFLNSIAYYATSLKITNVPSTIMYFGWSIVMSGLFSILTGTIGFAACFYFVRTIYGSIKVD